MARKQLRSKPCTILLLCIICLVTIFYFKENLYMRNVPRTDREALLLHVSSLINTGPGMLALEGQACRVPVLEVNATEIMDLLKEAPKVVCSKEEDWVKISGSTAKISQWAKKKFGNVECSFSDILRMSDYIQYEGLTTTTHTEYNLEASDVVKVHCTTESGITWKKVFMGIRSDQELIDRASWLKVPTDSLKLNILMLGFDSLSHNMWKRKLPKTYKYATNDLKGIALNGYNIVGDGTPQALIPILTGRTELELPETRKRMGAKANFVNVYPFIWNDYRQNGYITAWSEDMTGIGTFNYRLRGFKEQPVDHYMRTYYQEAAPEIENEKSYCYKGVPRFQIFLSFVRNVFEVHRDRPKFIFAFHSEFSHESNNMVSNADEDLFEFLQELNAKNYLNNTLLILMSDHGSRFADIRNTQQGKLEERLPGFAFIFPSWFPKKYPEAYENFKKNADRLTTPFDIHETLKNVLHFEGAGMGNLQNRGISLFKEVPLARSCQDASIEPHWCTCLNWEIVPTDGPVVMEAVKHLLNAINSYTSKQRHLCQELHVGKVLWSAKLIPNEHLLRFKKNSDFDGFLGDMSDYTTISIETYQVKVSLEPGNMIYEASVKFYTKEKRFVVLESEISRVNKYRDMTHCIEDRDILHHLRKYCNCL